MKIAVLMSTYNGEKYITEQIESILSQEGDFELELFVRDDGSSDSTQDILDCYQEDGKLSWYSGKNLGAAASFIDLLKRCGDFDYYSFADQDDYWEPFKIAEALKALSENKKAWIYFANARLVNENLDDLGRNVYNQMPRLDFETLSSAGGILGCTMVFADQLAKKIKAKPLPSKMVMHDFYVCELCLALGGEIISDTNAVMKYRQHSNNVIGVPVSFKNKIKNRIEDITTPQKVSVSIQADQILELYYDEISADKKLWLTKISNYKKSFRTRLSLAATRKTKYASKNMGLKLRLSILAGSR